MSMVSLKWAGVTNLRTACRAVVFARVKPSVHANLMEGVSTCQHAKFFIRDIILQTDQALCKGLLGAIFDIVKGYLPFQYSC